MAKDRTWTLLQAFGISLDASRNQQMVDGRIGSIEGAESDIKVLVIPTDEELSIAEQTVDVLKELRATSS